MKKGVQPASRNFPSNLRTTCQRQWGQYRSREPGNAPPEHQNHREVLRSGATRQGVERGPWGSQADSV